MALPARRREEHLEDAPLDPDAWGRAYREARLRRYARTERQRARRYASVRFFAVLAALLIASVFLTLAVWQQVERLFGL